MPSQGTNKNRWIALIDEQRKALDPSWRSYDLAVRAHCGAVSQRGRCQRSPRNGRAAPAPCVTVREPTYRGMPAAVRWLDANTAPGKALAAKWYGLPDGAAGALAFAWRDTHTADPDPRAVSMEAIDAAGERIEPRWRRTFGGSVANLTKACGGRAERGVAS